MEKKNNQMVDKEKELKNVAPDTDVAPDVTDASSFQGGPSHTSSNRQQMRLINRIDYYKWKINLLTELISVERENLEKSRDKRTDAYKERQRRKIFPLKLKASDVDEAVEELYGRDIEKFDKRQKLNFREYRQNLRRAEGLLNPDGTLKRFELDAEGNEIPFENVLSAESQELLKAFEVSQAEQRAAFMEGLRVKAVAAVGEGAADAEDIYEAARLEDETALESFVAEENAKIEKRMEKYVEATQFKINRYNEKLLSMQEKLAELMAEEEAKFGVELPSDVILRLDRLTMEFGGLKAVNNLSFDVKKGEIFGLIGPNGAARTSSWLTEIGWAWNEAAKLGSGRDYYYTTIPPVYSTYFYERRLDWMKNRAKKLIPYFDRKDVQESLIRLTNSSEGYDVSDRLGEVECPTLIVNATDDVLIPLVEQTRLHEGIKNSEMVIIPKCGHASMYEKPMLFSSLVLGWINVKDEDYESIFA